MESIVRLLSFYEGKAGFKAMTNTKLTFLNFIARLMTRSGLDGKPIEDTSDEIPDPPPHEDDPNTKEEEEDEQPPEPDCSD